MPWSASVQTRLAGAPVQAAMPGTLQTRGAGTRQTSRGSKRPHWVVGGTGHAVQPYAWGSGPWSISSLNWSRRTPFARSRGARLRAAHKGKAQPFPRMRGSSPRHTLFPHLIDSASLLRKLKSTTISPRRQESGTPRRRSAVACPFPCHCRRRSLGPDKHRRQCCLDSVTATACLTAQPGDQVASGSSGYIGRFTRRNTICVTSQWVAPGLSARIERSLIA